MICRSPQFLATWEAKVSMRDALHSTPFSPRNQSPSSSNSAPVYCVTDHHVSENLSRKNLEQGRHFGPLPPALAKSCTHYTQGSQGRGAQEFAFDTSRSTAPVLQICAVRCRPIPDAHPCATRVPPTRSRSCVHSFDAYLRRVEVSFRRLTSLHTLTEHRSSIHRCCSFRH